MKNTIEHTYKTNKEIDYPLLFVSIAMVGIIAIGVGFFQIQLIIMHLWCLIGLLVCLDLQYKFWYC